MDIVCGTLQAKLFTTDLSSGSSRYIQSLLLSPCDFLRQAGKAAARNWKNPIRFIDQPLARVLESYVAPDGKRCVRFVGCSSAYSPDDSSVNTVKIPNRLACSLLIRLLGRQQLYRRNLGRIWSPLHEIYHRILM